MDTTVQSQFGKAVSGRVSAVGPLSAFFALGVFWGAWSALVPDIKRLVGASEGELGFALLSIGLGALASMAFAGAAVDRLGSRVLQGSLLLFALTAVLPSLTHSVWHLSFALMGIGAASGAVDVAMNATMTARETRTGERLVQKAHALCAAGSFSASVSAGFLRSAGVPLWAVLLGISGVLLTAAMLNGDSLPKPQATSQPQAPRAVFTRTLLFFGLLGVLASVFEGGMENWSALFLEKDLHASPAVRGLGPGLCAAGIVLGRVLGHRLGARLSDRWLLAGGALLAAIGALGVATASVPCSALGSLFLAGLGISVVFPTLFVVAGNAGGESGRGGAISLVTMISYLGFLGGPALMGAVAGAWGLRSALLMLSATGVFLALSASVMRSLDRRT